MATADDVGRIAGPLPRTDIVLVGDRIKFRIGRIVYASLSPDETLLGFAFAKEERADLVASEPDVFLMPVRSDERYNWVRLRLAAVDEDRLREIVVDAWLMVVPKRVGQAYLDSRRDVAARVSKSPIRRQELTVADLVKTSAEARLSDDRPVRSG